MHLQTDATRPLEAHVVLGVGAHPDDLDGYSGGTIAKLVEAGAIVYYLILTDGSKGSHDPKCDLQTLVETRRQEQREAAAVLGVKEVFFAGYCDGQLKVDDPITRDVVRYIRQLKPDVVVTIDPSVIYDLEREVINHPDHRAAGQVTLDAVYPAARDQLAFPELLDEGLQPHEVATVLMINHTAPNYLVDTAACHEKKLAALAKHPSQGLDDDKIKSVIRKMDGQSGDKVHCRYAEPFVRIDVHPG
jgi:LmbE family N-acetylglucosaminyl deacetylase